VLAKCGFSQIGTAPNYLHIDGAWRDCHLFQRILNSREPGTEVVVSGVGGLRRG
jgi:ribosomal-protein-alanine N-acetyltransferase